MREADFPIEITQTALSLLDEEQKAEYWASLALKYSKNLGVRSVRKLMRYFGSAYKAVHEVKNWDKAHVPLSKAESILNNSWRIHARREWENAKDLNASILLWTDEKYPALLRELVDAPLFLYYKGDISLLSNSCLAIVGSRACSKEGERIATLLAQTLAKAGITIVSGVARGIDRAAHHAALSCVGSSIGVLGSGIDVVYPPKNSDTYFELGEKGLLISEFPPSTVPDPTNFPIRNRIISGLSLGTLVIEAGMKSGSLVTARIALDQNRSVYAVPGAIDSSYSLGCQELIREGAKAVFAASDILEDLFPQLQANVDIKVKGQKQVQKKIIPPILVVNDFATDSNEAKILEKITDEKKHLDTLCQELALILPTHEVTSLLVCLELSGHVRRHAGSWYTRT